jgi:hypothetical protein
MSAFRITYREHDSEVRTCEEVEAVEFIQQDPWIVFLDPSGVCLSVRSDNVERVERIVRSTPNADPEPGPASYPALPST